MSDENYTYRRGDADPSIALNWRKRATTEGGASTLIDLAAATFTVRLINRNRATVVDKSSGITGSSTWPNCVISWDVGELDLTPGVYEMEVVATIATRARTYSEGDLPTVTIKPAAAALA